MGTSTKPLFSVILPVYNVKDYLNACVDSIINQTFKDFEIILVDDGSSDGSGKICDNYSSKYENIITFHKPNGGQSSARNKGVELANGKFFIFVDSDDYIDLNTLNMFKEAIDELGDLDLILSEVMWDVNNEGVVIPRSNKLNMEDYHLLDGETALTKMYRTIPDWSPCGKCYRTQYWRQKGFRFIEGRISEDLQLIDRVILEAGTVSMVKGHYYYRSRISTSTMHGNYFKLVDDTIYVIDDWDKYLKTRPMNDELKTLIYKSLANMLEHTALGNIYYAPKDKIGYLLEESKKCIHILKYDESLEGRGVRFLLSVFGIRIACYALNVLKTKRKKRMSLE